MNEGWKDRCMTHAALILSVYLGALFVILAWMFHVRILVSFCQEQRFCKYQNKQLSEALLRSRDGRTWAMDAGLRKGWAKGALIRWLVGKRVAAGVSSGSAHLFTQASAYTNMSSALTHDDPLKHTYTHLIKKHCKSRNVYSVYNITLYTLYSLYLICQNEIVLLCTIY